MELETMLGWSMRIHARRAFAAMGIESYRLGGGEQEAATQNLLPINLCPLVRACLSEAGARLIGQGMDGSRYRRGRHTVVGSGGSGVLPWPGAHGQCF